MLNLGAQGFWFEESEDSDTAFGPGAVTIGGNISGELLIFPDDLKDGRAKDADWGNVASAALNFGASSSNAEAVLNFKLSPRTLQSLSQTSSDLFQTPMLIDELYVRAFLGKVILETGFRKLAWGRADIQGPLDVTNPLDYTDLTNVGDTMGRKIARPMIHASWSLGSFSKLEGVFVPSFQGHRYALDPQDRWYPTVITDSRKEDMVDGIMTGLIDRLPPPLNSPPVSSALVQQMGPNIPNINIVIPNTQGLEYAQGGLRFTTTIGPADFGVQYYSGHLFRPSFTVSGVNGLFEDVSNNSDGLLYIAGTNPPLLGPTIENIVRSAGLAPLVKYNRYHQIGVDYTQVLFDFSVRAELAANITADLAGDDGSVYNPSLAWSFGFDRDVFGFTLFLEADESIRLFNDKVGTNAATDTEAGSSLTATGITAQISRAFFQDKLEIKFSLLWNVETSDVYLMPSISYTMGDLEAVLAGGIFTGKDGGELSQYRNNGYIKTALTYSF
ncbi:MAG: hypothetical protein LBT39_00455 [Treponema sp.]|jgi:hypothetical protein|nr:hypothetical protein [Treponema sp.]